MSWKSRRRRQRGSYVAPDRAACDDQDWYYLDESGTIRIEFYIWRLAGRLVDFVVLLRAESADGRETLERIDCSHGYCHLHRSNQTVDNIAVLDSVSDVERVYNAIDLIIDARVRMLLSGREGRS